MTRTLVVTCALALVLTAACGEEKAREMGQKAAQTWKAVAEYTVEKKDQAVAFFGERMKDLEGQWAAAKERRADWSDEAKAALEDKWQKVQEAYAKSEDATGEAWSKARDSFKAAYDAFKAELEK